MKLIIVFNLILLVSKISYFLHAQHQGMWNFETEIVESDEVKCT